ncbi:MAG: DUF1573 domain-containing protein [Chlorobi bacterium]|nr:MAG: hypothetical protein UZ07_CHB004000045 [Chlorobi bacterium OLB7]MBK8910957.1 DUF1573 domain-containing protein [Chlorobiota bacterium]
MKRMKLSAMMATAFAALALVTASATAQQQPGKIEIVGGATYDWGNVAPGDLKATIEVKNVGEGVLNVKEVRPGCGCTAAPIDKNILNPGEVGKISVTLRASTSTGPLQKSITVTSDDPQTPVTIIYLKANVKRPFRVDPDWISVLNGKVGVESAVTVNIQNTGEEELMIFPPEANVTATVRFDLTTPKNLKPGESTPLTVFVTPTKTGPIAGQVKIKTSSKEMPEKAVDVVGSDVTAAGNAPTHN